MSESDIASRLDWTPTLAGRWRLATSDAVRQILDVTAAPDVISFSGGFPDPATFPVEELPGLVESVLTEAGAALQYAPTAGLPSTRAFLVDRVARLDGNRPGDDELMVTSGGMEALHLIAMSLLDVGDLVLVEGPTYLGAIMAFRSLEADVVAVPTDDDGLRTDQLESLLRSGVRPKLLYTIPDYQNPGGFSLSEERRRHLLELADHFGFLVVDDVAYRELWFDEPPASSLWAARPDLTVQIGTFSKVFLPGVRLGWAAGPAPIVAQMVAAKQTTDQCAGALGQRLVETFGRQGGLDAIVARSRPFYRGRRDRLLTALEREVGPLATWTRPGGGFYSWLTVAGDAPVDSTDLARRGRQHKVAFVPGAAFYPDGQGRSSIRLSYSRVSDADIATGVARIAETVRDAVRTRNGGDRTG